MDFLPNTLVNNAVLNLTGIWQKFSQLRFNKKKDEFWVLVVCSIHTTFCDELKGDSPSVLLSLLPRD